MAKPANEPIGEVACPFDGCKRQAKIKRFADNASSDTRRRKAGKVYCDCEVHGRFGFDGAAETQEYILNRGKFWAPNDQPASGAAGAPNNQAPPKPADRSPPQKTAAPSASKPAPASAPAPAKRKGIFDWGNP